MQWLALGALTYGGYCLVALSWPRDRKKLESDAFFPTLDLRTWGTKPDFSVEKDFPTLFRVGAKELRPLVRSSKIQGWWVRDQEEEDFYDDQRLVDQFGEAHVIF